eukprot:XP_020393662.1 uncharacterized protein LOC103628412 [Zea mays]
MERDRQDAAQKHRVVVRIADPMSEAKRARGSAKAAAFGGSKPVPAAKPAALGHSKASASLMGLCQAAVFADLVTSGALTADIAAEVKRLRAQHADAVREKSAVESKNRRMSEKVAAMEAEKTDLRHQLVEERRECHTPRPREPKSRCAGAALRRGHAGVGNGAGRGRPRWAGELRRARARAGAGAAPGGGSRAGARGLRQAGAALGGGARRGGGKPRRGKGWDARAGEPGGLTTIPRGAEAGAGGGTSWARHSEGGSRGTEGHRCWATPRPVVPRPGWGPRPGGGSLAGAGAGRWVGAPGWGQDTGWGKPCQGDMAGPRAMAMSAEADRAAAGTGAREREPGPTGRCHGRGREGRGKEERREGAYRAVRTNGVEGERGMRRVEERERKGGSLGRRWG